MIDLRSLQRALGGETSGGQLLCPGPGHSPRDRSLAVRPSPDGDGFVVHSHCGDAWTSAMSPPKGPSPRQLAGARVGAGGVMAAVRDAVIAYAV